VSGGVRVRHLPASGGRVHYGNRDRDGGKDAMETGFALSEIDTTMPHPAWMYDALLDACFF
jgi:hypothetical protein